MVSLWHMEKFDGLTMLVRFLRPLLRRGIVLVELAQREKGSRAPDQSKYNFMPIDHLNFSIVFYSTDRIWRVPRYRVMLHDSSWFNKHFHARHCLAAHCTSEYTG